MTAWYNEIDPHAAQWLRKLIRKGHIAPGVVDERSIADVHPDELSEFVQCHFFAGIGVWSYALRQAGWPDDRRIWTASCPCQPFSAAGSGTGFDDERHLCPALHWLVEKQRPPILIGEQVASKAVEPWVDLVHADLEALGYAFGCVAHPAASVGAPHVRDRVYWVGHTDSEGPQGHTWHDGPAGWQRSGRPATAAGILDRMADTCGVRSEVAHLDHGRCPASSCIGTTSVAGVCDTLERLADALSQQLSRWDGKQRLAVGRPGSGAGVARRGDAVELEPGGWRGPVNGLWADADWLFCRDGKWRPVEPGTSPLAHGAPARVGRLRAYGNAINASQAQKFIEVVMECLE